jgi:hypothetical protein
VSIPGWVTIEAAQEYLQAMMAKASKEKLQDHWQPLLEKKLVQAYWSIANAFIQRGFTRAQVDLWDRGAEFQADIAVFLAMQILGAVMPGDTGNLTALDRRPELMGDPQKGIEPVTLTIEGDPVDPEGTRGQITQGPMDTSEDLFTQVDRDDSRRGVVTKF